MERVLDAIDINRTLGLRDLCDNVLNGISNYIDNSYDVSKYFKTYRNYTDDRLQGLLNDDVRKEMSGVREGLQERIRNLPGDIAKIANKNATEASAKLEGIKNNIASKLQSGSEQYFQQFEEEIKNVEKVIPEYEKAIAQAEIIIKVLK
jgi:Cu/Ag efflux pump CusA